MATFLTVGSFGSTSMSVGFEGVEGGRNFSAEASRFLSAAIVNLTSFLGVKACSEHPGARLWWWCGTSLEGGSMLLVCVRTRKGGVG